MRSDMTKIHVHALMNLIQGSIYMAMARQPTDAST